jgi:hypothetical protein
MSSFVSNFMDYTATYESPGSFFRWSAYAIASATMRDNIYFQYKDSRIYANIYTLLLADSAMHRKGNGLRIASDLLRAIKNTKLVEGRASIQALLDDLADVGGMSKTGKTIMGGSAIFLAPELSAAIVEDPAAVKILTDIYDFKKDYPISLKGSGKKSVTNLCFSMLAASNEELLKSVYDSNAVYGGLLGRTFLVKPNEFRPPNSMLRGAAVADSDTPLSALIVALGDIAAVKGSVAFSEGAIADYESWYNPFRGSYRNKTDKSGILGRIHTSILKLSMILGVMDTLEPRVEKEHMEEAIELCLELLPNYEGFIMASGKSSIAEAGSIFLTELWTAKDRQMSRRDFFTKYWMEVDKEVFDTLIQTLQDAGMVETIMGSGTNTCYKMTPLCVSHYKTRGQ